jgi:hypothetical protein
MRLIPTLGCARPVEGNCSRFNLRGQCLTCGLIINQKIDAIVVSEGQERDKRPPDSNISAVETRFSAMAPI